MNTENSQTKSAAEALALTGSKAQDYRAAAGILTSERFSNQVFVRAVVEISNFCRENCVYCGMRRDNKTLDRYRMELNQLRALIFEDLPETVTDVNLQAGEDPVAVREIAIPLIREIKEKTELGISVCLGTLNHKLYSELLNAGAFYYIIKLETGDEHHYQKMQSPGTMQERLDAIQKLAKLNWCVSSGCIVGLPEQTPVMLAETLESLAQLPLSGCSVSPFIPGNETPTSNQLHASLETTLNAVAWMRRQNPDWIIPAVSAMNSVGENGYVKALQSGANLVTVNMTPDDLRENYVIYKRERFVMFEDRVLNAIENSGRIASPNSMAEHFSQHV